VVLASLKTRLFNVPRVGTGALVPAIRLFVSCRLSPTDRFDRWNELVPAGRIPPGLQIKAKTFRILE
jgi:hypothetical protein